MVTGFLRHRGPCSTTMQRRGRMMMMMVVGMMMESVGGMAVETAAERPSRTKRSEAEAAEWSVWFNSDKPTDGEGDFETTDSVSRTRQICSWHRRVTQAQCRVAGTNDSFDSSTTAFLEDRLLQACSRHGLICLNAQQTSGRRCHDYEVRFLCQDSQVDGGGDSLFPNLDFKIYILLAAVPLLVIILRLLWSCWWKPRLKRRRCLRRQQQQQRHRGSLASDGTLSSSSSQASIDSTLANPPPAYTELFGDGQPAVFSISGRECAGCGKCLHRDGFVQEGMVDVSLQGDERGTVVAATSAPPPPPPEDIPPPELDEVFEAEPSQDSDVTGGRSQTVSRPAGAVLRHSSPSSASLQGAEAPAPPPPHELSPSTSPVQCTCACHQLPPSGYVNLAFRRDSSTQVDSPLPLPPAAPPVLYPGMHKPVFPFARIGSVTSFTSLPDYEEALEILKKSGLFLDEQKV